MKQVPAYQCQGGLVPNGVSERCHGAVVVVSLKEGLPRQSRQRHSPGHVCPALPEQVRTRTMLNVSVDVIALLVRRVKLKHGSVRAPVPWSQDGWERKIMMHVFFLFLIIATFLYLFKSFLELRVRGNMFCHEETV